MCLLIATTNNIILTSTITSTITITIAIPHYHCHYHYFYTILISFQSISFSRQILGFINRVGTNVGSTKEPYEKPSVLKTKTLSMATDVQVPSQVEAMPLEDQGSKVTLPSTEELIGSNGTDQNFLSRQVSVFAIFLFSAKKKGFPLLVYGNCKLLFPVKQIR